MHGYQNAVLSAFLRQLESTQGPRKCGLRHVPFHSEGHLCS